MSTTIGALVGRVIGHHTVLDVIGEGGMGTVYRARDDRLGRTVALKVIRPEWTADADRRRRFQLEARAAAALNHPNILTIYEVGRDADVDYIAMEYVSSRTLVDLIAAGPLAPERALRLTAQVADALAAAHAAGIVHRDLKPANIMVVPEDRVKVVDFGLAKLVERRGTAPATEAVATRTGTIVGTAPYMSPEQAGGREIDGRSDLFSLGVVLYEMLAGRRPFDGPTASDTLAALLRDAPAPVPGLRPEVDQLLGRCLRKRPEDRFQSADDVKRAIDACLSPAMHLEGPSIAVLPFANMSGSAEDEYLCEGLSEEIINALTRIPGLRVIARTSSFVVGRMGLDVREAAARLGVASVLEGSVRRAGPRVRVTAQLIAGSDGSHLWSERYDRQLTDLLELEDEIAAAIATRFRVELAGGGRAGPRNAVDVSAHTAYLEGRYHFARGTPEALRKAAACYQRAIEIDRGFALAYDSLAELHWFSGFFGNVPPRDAFSASTWYAVRALELDDTLAETHALLGMLRKELDYNWPEVDYEVGRALELNRDSPLVRLRYAISGLLPRARMTEAMVETEAVVRADPLSIVARWWLAVTSYFARRYDRAAEEAARMIELDPGHFLGHWALGIERDASGGQAEAVAALRRSHELSGGSPFTLGFLAYVLGRAGRVDNARALLGHAEETSRVSYVPPSTFAFGFIGLGEWDAAFEWLDRMVDGRDPLVMPIQSYPFLDGVRDDPRYLALLRKMNLA
jgi:TolB-like protein